MSDKILMPKALTAENGAKGLLIGEFHESVVIQCTYCDGAGYADSDLTEVCDSCDGAGCYSLKVPISWTTIKEIYAMAVKELSEETTNV